MNFIAFIFLILIAPFLSGLISKVKAFFGSKIGQNLFYPYFSIIKLLKKGAVYSKTTTIIFQIAPVISIITSFAALLFIPFFADKSIISFNYDFVFIFYLFALGRFFTVISALDTGSPFEGMGASREVFFAVLAEVAVFVVLIYFVKITGMISLKDFFTHNLWEQGGFLNLLIIMSIFIIMLTECSRVPVDDPNTHLELTMIHEVMVLDNSGTDMALIHLGSDFKLLFYSSLIAKIVTAGIYNTTISFILFLLCLLIIYVFIGIIESSFARYKMNLVPKFILSSFALAAFAVVLLVGFLNV